MVKKDLAKNIEEIGVGFVGLYLMELVDNYEQIIDSETRDDFIDYFYEEYMEEVMDRKKATKKVDMTLDIIKSGLVFDAIEYVVSSRKANKEAKESAKYLKQLLENGDSVLPTL